MAGACHEAGESALSTLCLTAGQKSSLALVKKLNVQPQDNFVSQHLVKQSDALVAEMRQLSGQAFDRRYAGNELSYHQAVNRLVEGTFLPRSD
jgi:putative membrane protein